MYKNTKTIVSSLIQRRHQMFNKVNQSLECQHLIMKCPMLIKVLWVSMTLATVSYRMKENLINFLDATGKLNILKICSLQKVIKVSRKSVQYNTRGAKTH